MASIIKLWQRPTRADRFEDLLRPHIAQLYRLAYRLTGSEADSEDLLQDLVIKLHTRADEIAQLDKPGIWLARVLYRLYVDRHRRAARRPTSISDLGDADCGDDPIDSLAAEESEQPDRLTERHLNAQRLQATVDALDDDRRTVVLLHDVEGYRLTEIAEMLDLPVGTLKSRLHRARHQLRDYLKQGTF